MLGSRIRAYDEEQKRVNKILEEAENEREVHNLIKVLPFILAFFDLLYILSFPVNCFYDYCVPYIKNDFKDYFSYRALNLEKPPSEVVWGFVNENEEKNLDPKHYLALETIATTMSFEPKRVSNDIERLCNSYIEFINMPREHEEFYTFSMHTKQRYAEIYDSYQWLAIVYKLGLWVIHAIWIFIIFRLILYVSMKLKKKTK